MCCDDDAATEKSQVYAHRIRTYIMNMHLTSTNPILFLIINSIPPTTHVFFDHKGKQNTTITVCIMHAYLNFMYMH